MASAGGRIREDVFYQRGGSPLHIKVVVSGEAQIRREMRRDDAVFVKRWEIERGVIYMSPTL